MTRPTGLGKTEKRATPPSLMLYNFDIDGDKLKDQHKIFLRVEAFPTLRAGGSVSIIGLTDRKGSAAHNQALSERRVAETVLFLRSEVSNGFNVKQATGFGESAATQEGDVDGTLNERFRTVLLFLSKTPVPPPVTSVKTQTIQIVIKSFIAVIGGSVGTLPGRTVVVLPLPTLPVPFIPVPTSNQTLLEILAKATDVAYSENPVTVSKDKHYRLFSACNFTVTWSEGKLLGATASALETDGGKEGPLQPPPLIATPVTTGFAGASIFTFSWTAKGRPHLAAEPAFQLVQPRTSFYIWHSISGQINVSSGVPLFTGRLLGSKFPSHRLFVDGKRSVVPPELPQGVFSNLWVPDPSDFTKVK